MRTSNVLIRRRPAGRLAPMALKDTLTKEQSGKLQQVMRGEPMAKDKTTELKELIEMGLVKHARGGRVRVAWEAIPRETAAGQE